MKIRSGFVSNNSSSSFVCDICGDRDTYYDGLEDVGGVRCENGHEFHKVCGKDKLVMIEDDYWGTCVSKESCHCCRLDVLTETDKLNFLYRKVGMDDAQILKALHEEKGIVS